ncbi:hypothetical protein SEEE5646_10134, partial [Salmonella enterica subsp. enterica serovar Enteritidis str. 50-5646]
LTGFVNEPGRVISVPKLFTWLAGWGNDGDERWARDPLFYRADCRACYSAPVPEQPYIAILLVRIYLVTGCEL